MAFREDDDARIARIDELERELARAREELERLAGVEAERDRLAARVEELEGQLGIRNEKQKKKEREKERARAEQEAREARARSERSATSPSKRSGNEGRALLGGAVILVAGLGAATAYFNCVGKSPTELLGGPPPPPSIGVVDLDATPSPPTVSGAVTANAPAPDDCRGFLPDAPQLVLRTAHATALRMTATSPIDLVAMIETPDGARRCEDDSHGTDPEIVMQIPAGDSRLYVGTYAPNTAANFDVHLAAAPASSSDGPGELALAAAPRIDTVHVGDAAIARVLEGTVSVPWIDAREVSAGCAGFVAREPDLVLDVTAPTFVRLEAQSQEDLVMLLAEPEVTFVCDDDSGMGNAPRIAKRLGPGRYPVWVGPYAEEHAGTPFRLFLRAAPESALGQAATTPIPVTMGTVARAHGTSGDDVAGASAWPSCASSSFVPLAPQVSLSVAARSDLSVRLQTQAAPFFALVRGTQLVTCVDANTWRGTVDPGRYDVYVGVVNDTWPADFTLEASTTAPSVLPYTP